MQNDVDQLKYGKKLNCLNRPIIVSNDFLPLMRRAIRNMIVDCKTIPTVGNFNFLKDYTVNSEASSAPECTYSRSTIYRFMQQNGLILRSQIHTMSTRANLWKLSKCRRKYFGSINITQKCFKFSTKMKHCSTRIWPLFESGVMDTKVPLRIELSQ